MLDPFVVKGASLVKDSTVELASLNVDFWVSVTYGDKK